MFTSFSGPPPHIGVLTLLYQVYDLHNVGGLQSPGDRAIAIVYNLYMCIACRFLIRETKTLLQWE